MTAAAGAPESSVAGSPTAAARCRRGRGGEHDRRLEVDLVLRLGKPRELEAALEELVGRRRRQREARRRSSARAATSRPRVPISVWSTRMSRWASTILVSTSSSCGALRRDAERDQVAAERRAGAAGDHEHANGSCARSLQAFLACTGLRCGPRCAGAPSGRAGSRPARAPTGQPAWRPARTSARRDRRSPGRWREPAGVAPLRSRKKRFTIRSSRL